METAITATFEALTIYFPAFIANAAPVLAGASKILARFRIPIWEKGLGANKTWRGLIVGVCAGVVAGWIELLFRPFEYSIQTWLLWSAAISFGALFADAAKSYLKRKIGIPPGGALPVIDGIDYVVGAMVFGLPFYTPSVGVVIALLILGPVLSLLANVFSYALGWKKVWY